VLAKCEITNGIAVQHHGWNYWEGQRICGYGGIGRETARLAKAHGMRVHVMRRCGVGPRENVYVLPGVGDPVGRLPDRVYTKGEESEFLSALDFLV